MFLGDRVYALIVAAGRSTRMGRDKLFVRLGDRLLLAHSVEAFLAHSAVDGILVAVRKERLTQCVRLAQRRSWPACVRFCTGGERRQDTVRLGLQALPTDGWVLVHDGARPLVSPELIARGLEAAVKVGAAVPALPVVDTVKRVSERGLVEETLPRERLVAVQTPQVFRIGLLREAHERLGQGAQTFTDDASLLEALGMPVAVFAGDPVNVKVTTQEDLEYVRSLWRRRRRADGGVAGRAGI
ncbi:MAG: 2-C-methyl-D-erythritol 4-phosphate cytidylyltransferase [Chloroflexia bacterium]